MQFQLPQIKNNILQRDKDGFGQKKKKLSTLAERLPTNKSAIVKLMTKYMLRVRGLFFFIKRMMEMRFTVTIATHSAVNTLKKMMHSDKEIFILSWVISSMVLLFLEFVLSATITCKKNNLWWVVWSKERSASQLEKTIVKYDIVDIASILVKTFGTLGVSGDENVIHVDPSPYIVL